MNEVDIQAPAEGSADISDTETQLDTPEAPSSTPAETQSQTEPEKPYTPFSSGKEKFKVGGQEFEWDWETTRKYAQLGRSGQVAMERAAQTEKKAKDAYQKLLKAAQEDPVGLLRVLNPTFDASQLTKSQQRQAAGEAARGAAEADQIDPRDQKIKELEQRYQSVAEVIEKQEIENERKVIESELEEAIKKYPVLNNKIFRAHVKTQYRQALANGLEDLSIDDVAFHVAQEIQDMKAAEEKAKIEKAKENRRRAPVSTPTGGTGEKKSGMTLEEVKKLAGRA